MIYIYNSNIKFNKQIQYSFMNVFNVLGLKYINLNSLEEYTLNKEDILICYKGEEHLDKLIDEFQNIIIIQESYGIFSDKYLKPESIPENIKRYNEVISIYSKDEKLYIRKDFHNKKIIETNIDIISDIFFMLTRYEEVVNNEINDREPHKRFSATESLAYKNNFLQRPIVNEHIDLIWEFINSFNLSYIRKKWWGDKEFVACLTHDVDHIQKYKSFKEVIRPAFSFILKQGKPNRGLKLLFNSLSGYEKDPYNTFDYIIDLEKSYGFTSSFYFMSGRNNKFDGSYDINDSRIKDLIEEVEKEGFEAGYHCSYDSYLDEHMVQEEKSILDILIRNKPYGGRQHFLRFKAPYSWRNQEKAGLLYDTTLGFADAEGFRCGTCFPFKPYDILEDRILNIYELPLMVMEASLRNANYRNYSAEEGLEVTKKLIDTVKKHNGVFTLLYHNSSFDAFEVLWDGWKETYEGTMEYLHESNCYGLSGREVISFLDNIKK